MSLKEEGKVHERRHGGGKGYVFRNRKRTKEKGEDDKKNRKELRCRQN